MGFSHCLILTCESAPKSKKADVLPITMLNRLPKEQESLGHRKGASRNQS